MVYLYLEKPNRTTTLQKNINESFTDHMNVSSGDISSRLNIYSTIDKNTNTYVRNTGNWITRLSSQYPNLDLTGISLNLDQIEYNTTQQTEKGLSYNDGSTLIFPSGYPYGIEAQCCTLLNEQYAIGVNHYAIPLNSKIRFITMDNQIVERTVSTGLMIYDSGIMDYNRNYIYNPSSPYPNCEFNIIKFDLPIESNIKKYSLMPKFYHKIYKRLTKNEFIYTICVNGPQELLVKKFFGGVGFYNELGAYNMFSKNVVVGDSSHPIFTIVNDELSYISSWSSRDLYNNGVATPVFEGSVISGIVKAVELLGNEYEVKIKDITSFNKFYPE